MMITQRLLLCALLVAPAFAAATGPAQLSLVGFAGRDGALSTEGREHRVVYLLWGAVDGELSPRLAPGAELVLRRDGAEVWAASAAGTATAATIGALYARNGSQSRRQALTDRSLKALLTSEAGVGITLGSPPGAPFAQRLAAALAASRLPGQATLRAWARVAASRDPNVAAALHQGYVDTLPAGPVTYRLLARLDGVEQLLAQVAVDPAKESRAPAAVGLTDVTPELLRCDAPEGGRAHGAVALTWDHPATSDTERFLHGLYVTGYDVWRTDAPCTSPGTVDLRALAAAQSGTDLSIPGLVRMTDEAVVIASPAPLRQSQRPAPEWNPAFAQIEWDPATLRAQGLRPSDERCFYVVPLDRSGNYGETVGVAATVFDAVKPETPWEVQYVPQSRRLLEGVAVIDVDEAFLEWASLDVPTWAGERGRDAAICATEGPGRLSVSTAGDGCAAREAWREVNLDVVGYRVYQFDEPRAAQAFADADGDGWDDAAERASAADPGLACVANPSRGPALVAEPPATAVTDIGGVRRVRVPLTVSAADRGQVRWYRVAAVGRNGLVSALTPPVRAFFPDERKPEPFDPDQIGVGQCGYGVWQELIGGPDAYPAVIGNTPVLAVDHSGRARTLRLYCEPFVEFGEQQWVVADAFDLDAAARRIDSFVGDIPFEAPPKGPAYAPYDASVCDVALMERWCPPNPWGCNPGQCRIHAEILDADGQVLGLIDPVEPEIDGWMPDPVDGACNFVLVGDDGNCHEGFLPLPRGAAVQGGLTVTLPPMSEGECAEVAVVVDDPAAEGEGEGTPSPGLLAAPAVRPRSHRLARTCWPDTTLTIPLPVLGPTQQCLTVRRRNSNMLSSVDVGLGCFPVIPESKSQKIPPLPQLVSVAFAAEGSPSLGALEWVAPSQPIGGLFAEWYKEGDPSIASGFLAYERPASGERIASSFPIGSALAPGTQERWCVRVRSVSAATAKDLGGVLSANWSSPLCAVRRRDADPLPQYLGWPTIPEPAELGTLTASYLTADGVPFIEIGSFSPTGATLSEPNCFPAPAEPRYALTPYECRPESVEPCLPTWPLEADHSYRSKVAPYCRAFCTEVGALMAPFDRFVVYRQRRERASGAVEPYVQVSPALHRPTCHTGRFDGTGGPWSNPYDVDDHRYHVDDPWFEVLRFEGEPPVLKLVLLDRAPHIGGEDYRYQLVFFGPDGEPSGYRQTGWVEVP